MTDDNSGVIVISAPADAHGYIDEWLNDVIEDGESELSDKEFVVTTPEMTLAELPRLDDYADELADRVAERVNTDE